MSKGQSKKQSIVEAIANVASGMSIAWGLSLALTIYESQVQEYIWAGFVWNTTASSTAIVTVILTLVSITRSYAWRRTFNRIHVKQNKGV